MSYLDFWNWLEKGMNWARRNASTDQASILNDGSWAWTNSVHYFALFACCVLKVKGINDDTDMNIIQIKNTKLSLFRTHCNFNLVAK